MFGKHKADVLVVGAGPVGLFSAILLAERGLKVAIVDESFRTAGHSYALALHPAALELLSPFGMTAAVLERALRVDRVALFDGERERARISLADLPGEYPFLAVLPQSDFEAVLEQRLERLGIKVLWNHRLAEFEPRTDGVSATVHQMSKVSSGYAVAQAEWALEKTHTWECAFLLGADGHRSRVRRSLGIEYQEMASPQHFAVFEFQVGDGFEEEVRIFFESERAGVFWPLPDGRCRASFQITPEEAAGARREKSRLTVQIGEMEFPYLQPDTLGRLVAERTPWFSAVIGELHWSLVVRFQHSLAESFGRDRVWLVGDSGHLTGPVGGQSMNVGLREAHDLAAALAAVQSEGASSGRLAAYDSARRAEWRTLHGDGGRGLLAGEGADPWVAQYLDGLLPCIPGSGSHLDMIAAQLGLTLGASS